MKGTWTASSFPRTSQALILVVLALSSGCSPKSPEAPTNTSIATSTAADTSATTSTHTSAGTSTGTSTSTGTLSGTVTITATGTSTSTSTAGGSPVSRSLQVSWAANRERGVNASGGGYRVYYGTQSGFSTAGASFVSVPYVAGASAPTTATISGLSPGTYYVKVNAYSAQNPSGATSAQASVSLP